LSGTTLKLAVILGSVREGRFGPVVAQWFLDQAQQDGQFDIDLVDLAETPLPAILPATPEELAATDERPAPLAHLAGRLDEADAFVFVTPEYNHSFPASVKNLVDWHFTQWQAKPVAFVSYGGFGGGLRAIEHLRLVLAEMHAVTIRDTVSFDNHWMRFDDDGELVEADGPNAAAKTLLDRLSWWATVLHEARQKSPYNAP
jgi:NAD(P)H-dependent FMN reductase